MRRLIAVVLFASAFCLVGYMTTGLSMAEGSAVKTEDAKPLIKCSTCGVEFTSRAGLVDHLKTHPGHMTATSGETKPLIRCSTCGALFTSSAGIEDHVKANPTHIADASKPLIKCSTCGVEFTSTRGVAEHLKAHPEHKIAPTE